MTSPIFNLGDEVEIIGPDVFGVPVNLGYKFKIDQRSKDGSLYSASGYAIYPASSLRLVDGLKIGDLVEVIGPFCSVFRPRRDDLKIFKIDYRLDTGCYGYDSGRPSYPAKSLRKLTPEEIKQHTGTIGYQTQKCNEELQKAKDALREILAPLVDERLSAIEKALRILTERQTESEKWQDQIAKAFREAGH